MQIGEIARMAGCKVVTVRYYEKKGLMARPDRTVSNYRDYTMEDAERLRFIRHCRLHGMSLEEIGELITLSGQAGGNCQRVHQIIRNHMDNIARQIDELEKLRHFLQEIMLKCSARGNQECGILRELRDMDDCICQHCEFAKGDE